MSIQGKLSNKQSPLKRKLMDYKIRLSGNCSQVIRLHVTEDKYEDEEVSVISHCLILAIIDYPGEIPLYRLRGTAQNEIDDNTGVFFYDVIPIEIYTQWKDKVEPGDILVRKILDENDNYLLNVLRVSNVLGSFKNNLVWKKCYASPHNMTLTQEIQDIIDTY